MSVFQRSVRLAFAAFFVLCILGLAAAVAAAPAAPPGVSAAPAQAAGLASGMTIGQIMQSGGWLMWVLAAMSVVSVAMIIYLFAVLRTEEIVPRALLLDLVARLKAGAAEETRCLRWFWPPLTTCATSPELTPRN